MFGRLVRCSVFALTLSVVACSPATPQPNATETAVDQVLGQSVVVTAPPDPPDLTGWNVTLVTPADDPGAARLAAGVRRAVHEAGGRVAEVWAQPGENGVREAVEQAMSASPEVIVGVGDKTVDDLALISAGTLQQQFLVVGAQFAEPTENATSVVWPGATSRGSFEPPDDTLKPEVLTEDNGYLATQAGFSSILEDTTGVVLRLQITPPTPSNSRVN